MLCVVIFPDINPYKSLSKSSHLAPSCRRPPHVMIQGQNKAMYLYHREFMSGHMCFNEFMNTLPKKHPSLPPPLINSTVVIQTHVHLTKTS